MTRTIALVFALILTAAPAQAGGLDSFDWLVGTWKRDTVRGDVYETWRSLGELAMEGSTRRESKQKDESRLTEALLLVEMCGDVYYIARPAENPYPVAFRLVSSENGRSVFENPTHDFPTRIVYTRKGDDAMLVTIEGPTADGGKPREIAFPFERVP